MIYCTCPGWPSEGFGPRADGWWVHAKCWLPRRKYLEQAMKDDPEVGQMLNIFRYGERHNSIHETKELMSSHLFGWVVAYKWTPEIIYGSESGRPARVWVHKDHVQEQ